MKTSDLREGYRQAIASPLTISEFEEKNGQIFVLYETKWVRIILIRRSEDSGNTFEVELSLPANIGTEQDCLAATISAMIKHLHYMLYLQQFGFDLDLMEHDFLWTATLNVRKEPESDLFEVLLPPSV